MHMILVTNLFIIVMSSFRLRSCVFYVLSVFLLSPPVSSTTACMYAIKAKARELKPGILIQRVLQGNLTSRALQSSKWQLIGKSQWC